MDWLTEMQKSVSEPVYGFLADYWMFVAVLAALGVLYLWNGGWIGGSGTDSGSDHDTGGIDGSDGGDGGD